PQEMAKLRKSLSHHPCHQCSDRESHARWSERWWKLEKETEKVRSQIRRRTGAISTTFTRVMDVLLETGYLKQGDSELEITDHGTILRRIYGERDLLVAECLRRQAWSDLSASELAAMVAALVYEPRRDDGPVDPRFLPGGNFPGALDHTRRLHRKLTEVEMKHQLPVSSELSPQLALAVYRWAQGHHLDDILEGDEVQVGDFVRWCKQIVDVLDQIITVGVGPIHHTALEARALVFRGIVALSSVA
ncbi:MAG: RNA helicase, partial [Pontimonas sp.]|nr:RNA helicase [Pontimonas sp.]